MARLSATFVLLSIALATRGMPSSEGYDNSNDSKQQQPEKQAFWSGADCVDSCRSRWGWTGHVFGNDPWGKVMSSGDPVLTSTSGSSSEAESTSSSTEPAATVKIFNLPTASAPINVGPATSPSSSSSTSSSSSSKPSSASISSTSEGATVHIFNVPANTNTKPPTLPTLQIFADPTTTSTPEPEPTPEPKPEPKTQAPKPDPTPEPEQPKPAPPQQDDGGDVTGDRAQYLKFHNDARDQHDAKPLTYSLQLENFAQQWADNCVFEHSGGKFGRVGENLAVGTGVYGIEEMIRDWVNEVDDYDPGIKKPSHFTQVVWKETTQVGCAKQTCNGILGKGPATYYVCEYLPAGNVIGHFDENVTK